MIIDTMQCPLDWLIYPIQMAQASNQSFNCEVQWCVNVPLEILVRWTNRRDMVYYILLFNNRLSFKQTHVPHCGFVGGVGLFANNYSRPQKLLAYVSRLDCFFCSVLLCKFNIILLYYIQEPKMYVKQNIFLHPNAK